MRCTLRCDAFFLSIVTFSGWRWRSEDTNALHLEMRCIFPVHRDHPENCTKESASQSRQDPHRNLLATLPYN